MSHRYYLKIYACLGIAVFSIAFFSLPAASAAFENVEVVRLITPVPGSEVIAKRPDIVFSIAPSFPADTILVLLDGIDVTGIINATPDGFSFRTVEMLAAGQHVLQIFVTSADNTTLEKEFSFSTRHSETFEESYSKNDLSISYEKTLKEPDDNTYQPSYRVAVNLADESFIREQKWQMSFNTNLRYLDQNLAINPPLEKGINLANYLLTGAYNGDRYQALAEFGDVNVSETNYTVSLARRGGTFSLDYDFLKLKTFLINSEEVFGFNGGTGLSGDLDDHIFGVSGEFGLFSDRLKLRTIYVTGGEKGDSYNIYTVGENKKGSVIGFNASSELLENKLRLEAELDYSRYDPDTSDEFSYENDRAFKLGATGNWDNYTYGAIYEYIGTDYQVIANPYLQGDRKGFAANFGFNHVIHTASVALSKYTDNVNKNPLYPESDISQAQINYNYLKLTNLPLGLVYQHSTFETSKEPVNTQHAEYTIDALTATANYLIDSWNIGFITAYSEQDDKTPWDYDTDAVNSTLSISYFTQLITITPSVSFNRSRFKPTSVDTDTGTVTLDLRGTAWKQKITYELGGTFSRMETNDNTMKHDSYNTNFRIAYILAPRLWGMNYPALGLMGNYYGTEDHVFNSTSDKFTLLFVLSTSIPFVL